MSSYGEAGADGAGALWPEAGGPWNCLLGWAGSGPFGAGASAPATDWSGTDFRATAPGAPVTAAGDAEDIRSANCAKTGFSPGRAGGRWPLPEALFGESADGAEAAVAPDTPLAAD